MVNTKLNNMCFWPYHYKKRTGQRNYRVHNEHKTYEPKHIYIHLQGKYQQTIDMCLCIIPANFTNCYHNVIHNPQLTTMNVGKTKTL